MILVGNNGMTDCITINTFVSFNNKTKKIDENTNVEYFKTRIKNQLVPKDEMS